MYATLITIHLVSMAAAVGMGIFVSTLAVVTRRTAPESAPTVMGAAGHAASWVAVTSVTILWVSGAWMAFGYGTAEGAGRSFDIKLGLAALLTVTVFFNFWYGSRARKSGQPQKAAVMSKRLGPLLLLLGIGAVIAAVLTFG